MLQFDKSIHQVVLYEYYLNGIFMKIHENLKMRKNLIKTIGLGEGLRYSLSCTPRDFNFMPNCSVGPYNAKRSSPQNILVWAM